MKKSTFILIYALFSVYCIYTPTILATTIYNDSDITVFVTRSNICGDKYLAPEKKMNCAHGKKGVVQICYNLSWRNDTISMSESNPRPVYCKDWSDKTKKCKEIGFISIYGNKDKTTKHTTQPKEHCVYYWKPGHIGYTYRNCIETNRASNSNIAPCYDE